MNKNGFTLMELLVVISILVVVSVSSTLVFNSASTSSEEEDLKRTYQSIQRTAEVYLNVAEAAYRTGNAVLANKLLNDLKRERYSAYVDVTLAGQALLDEIMLQRRLELAFENDRLYTFKRQGLAMQRTGEGPNIDGTGVASLIQNIAASDYRWQWPIPKGAIDVNPNIQQNPSY